MTVRSVRLAIVDNTFVMSYQRRDIYGCRYDNRQRKRRYCLYIINSSCRSSSQAHKLLFLQQDVFDDSIALHL